VGAAVKLIVAASEILLASRRINVARPDFIRLVLKV
jgi:hypothetical protein